MKAGPKKRRAKSEEKALREAIEENRRRGKAPATRSATKVHKYKYKDVEKKKPARKLSLDPTAEGMSGRNKREWEKWEEAIMFADPGQALTALGKHQILCDHKALREARATAVAPSSTYDTWQEYRTCPDCQAILKWWGSYTATIQGEWMQLRLAGYDMPSWGELFTKDKSLWVFVLEEAHSALNDKIGEEGDDNGHES